MVIRFESEYKSLGSFVSEDLGNFAVITGKNGSGKTQLIQLISMLKDEHGPPDTASKIRFEPTLTNIQVEGIAIQNVQILKGEQITKQLDQSYSTFQQIPSKVKTFISELIQNGFNLSQIKPYSDFGDYMSEKQQEEKIQRLSILAHETGHIWAEPNPTHRYEKLTHHIANKLYEWKKAIICAKHVSEYKNKRIESLDKNDFSSTPISETYYTSDNLFSVQIENLFYGYARKRFYNEMDFNRKERNGTTNNSLSNNDFLDKFPPPWLLINEILAKHKLKFRVPEIKPEDYSPEYEFDFSLLDEHNNKEIKFEDLSSGEKIIMGLIIRLFLTRTYADDVKFPECIIFDEPDTFLHPEMSSLLIEVLYKTFVQELGIKVLFTTHSPSTVALSPDDCIFELQNGKNTSLKKITKDNALKILTENLPLLSIDYNNHRQVFVESPTDQFYYQTIFNKLKSDKKVLFNLYFITTGYGKSNCAEVLKLTKAIRQSGNRSCFGILDWDLKDRRDDFIFVHGFDKRYSIENFILDPIYLCILFIEQKCANGIGDLGFNRTYNQYSLINENEVKLQDLTNWVLQKFTQQFNILKIENLEEITYANGKKVNIPQWYLRMKGHVLITKLKEVFPSLNGFKNEGELQERMTEIMGKCYPLVPKESVDLIAVLSK